ncbi:S-adenosylmethionine:tRNA ribosyltransferase-isomerase [Amycolatopsis pithecellobii]|uniref:S-adenosylmethionine:tRNA ribosyltransferase-isomerase n=1 Tax=Amycolatopsis pithecellobii TaxID=664692 RepID=A0A6N7ZC49_9PSEU|nr:S-adenosylmethionine:tRNA ribosyltransferase-isomerase [Amycolatopsis pithecellobii]MTD59269.1 S-adenosylmethionine:tRNA ribosyltransferase-isomerase [Amycolatopsis pithecellobii]
MTIPFTLPPGSEARRPPEHRGLRRDGVRLLVARPGVIEHRRFHDLPELLAPGDLVVVNTSATLPAALDAVRDNGKPAPVHVSTPLDDGDWVIEVRLGDASGPDLSLHAGERLYLPGGAVLTLLAHHPPATSGTRLWRAAVTPRVSARSYLPRHGRPIGYGYLTGRFPLRDYQTVYATEPGSAEMASAGRPFTEPLLVRLMARGVIVAPVVLHAGVSSPELHEPPMAERFAVPASTARLVDVVRAAGQRVVAVGTTVVRALESAAGPDGSMRAATGWTDLVLGPDRPARVVGGLVTGLHAPEASHLLLLEAVAGRPLVEAAYEAAVRQRYLWHEFGDSTLFLP